MPDGGRPNHRFGEELRRYEQARVNGTPEYAKRKDYPGAVARDYRCTDTACLNFSGVSDHATWFLCAECGGLAPDTIEYCTHVPYKVLPPKSKRLQANKAAFAAWISWRKRAAEAV